jgi:hypothetical protein
MLAVGTLAACTSIGGAPLPAAGNTPSSPGTAASLPPRPKDLKIDGIDPCILLTKPQQQQLGLDRDPRPDNANDTKEIDRFGNRGCSFDKTASEPRYGYLIVPVPQEGADAWLTQKRNATAKPVDAEGYGALELHLPLPPGRTEQGPFCEVVVDVAQGQSLTVQFSQITRGAFSHDQLCERARQGAGLAVQTLRTLQR